MHFSPQVRLWSLMYQWLCIWCFATLVGTVMSHFIRLLLQRNATDSTIEQTAWGGATCRNWNDAVGKNMDKDASVLSSISMRLPASSAVQQSLLSLSHSSVSQPLGRDTTEIMWDDVRCAAKNDPLLVEKKQNIPLWRENRLTFVLKHKINVSLFSSGDISSVCI